MNLLKLEELKRELEMEILSQYDTETGEIIGDDTKLQEQLQLVEIEIKAKAEQYVHLLKDKFFDKVDEKLKEKIDELNKERKWIKRRKEITELALHNYLQGKPMEAVIEDVKLYCSPDYSIRNSVIEEKVPAEIGKYIIETDYETYQKIKDYVTYSARKINVSDIPDNLKDQCLKKSIRPTVKITKSLPKEK